MKCHSIEMKTLRKPVPAVNLTQDWLLADDEFKSRHRAASSKRFTRQRHLTVGSPEIWVIRLGDTVSGISLRSLQNRRTRGD